MFRFDTTITEERYTEFNLFHNEKSKYGRKIIGWYRTALVMLLVIMSILVVVRNLEAGWSVLVSLIPIFFVCGLFFVLIKPFIRLGNKLTIKMASKIGKNLYSPVSTMEFFEEYVVETTPEIETKTSYTALDCAYFVRGEVVYIYINIQQALILPRASFESQEQWDSFFEFIKVKIKDITVVE